MFSGFVDYLDLLSFLVEVGSEVHESHVTPPSHSIKTDDVSMILERANAFKLHSVRETKVKNKSRHDPSVAVSLQDSLSSALKVIQDSCCCNAFSSLPLALRFGLSSGGGQ